LVEPRLCSQVKLPDAVRGQSHNIGTEHSCNT
jgi:hypothetical protein